MKTLRLTAGELSDVLEALTSKRLQRQERLDAMLASDGESVSAELRGLVQRGAALERKLVKAREQSKRVRTKADRALDESWRREQAMEAGMLHGCEAYNEAMGWEIDE